MFGFFRFVLAILVVAAHIWQPANGLSIIGGYAVYGFFILSGYLMTLVTNQNYGFTNIGVKRFLTNRFLRIYPTYWISIIFTLLLLLIFGEFQLSQFNPHLAFPSTFYDYFANVFIFGLAKTGFFSLHSIILSPPAWALEIELTFYILIGLFLGKKKYLKPWLLSTFLLIIGLKIVFYIMSLYTKQAYGFSYGSLIYASLAFCLGAFIFHYKDKLLHLKNRLPLPDLALILLLVTFWISSLLWVAPISSTAGFVMNTIVMFLLIICFAGFQNKKIKRLDKKLGDLSYPMYLLHYQIAFLVSRLTLQQYGKGFELFIASFPVLLGVSWLIIIFFESPIAAIRDKVRKS